MNPEEVQQLIQYGCICHKQTLPMYDPVKKVNVSVDVYICQSIVNMLQSTFWFIDTRINQHRINNGSIMDVDLPKPALNLPKLKKITLPSVNQ